MHLPLGCADRSPGLPAPPPCVICDQFTLERTTALDEQRLVDRLVADAHGLIIGEVDLQPVARSAQAPSTTAGLGHGACSDPSTAAVLGPGTIVPSHERSGEPVLHVLSTRRCRQLRGLRTLCCLLRLPRPPRRARRPRVAALRRTSRQTVPATTVDRAAISRTPLSWALSSAISSRSANDKYRPVGSSRLSGVASVSKPSNPDRRRHAGPRRPGPSRRPGCDQTPKLPLYSSRRLGGLVAHIGARIALSAADCRRARPAWIPPSSVEPIQHLIKVLRLRAPIRRPAGACERPPQRTASRGGGLERVFDELGAQCGRRGPTQRGCSSR